MHIQRVRHLMAQGQGQADITAESVTYSCQSVNRELSVTACRADEHRIEIGVCHLTPSPLNSSQEEKTLHIRKVPMVRFITFIYLLPFK